MSIMGRHVPGGVVAAVVLMLGAGAVAVAMWRPAAPDREIRLVVRGMAFYLESDPSTPNPTLTIRAGERVRIVLDNQDRGMTHDFAVPAIGQAIDAIDWNERGEVVVAVPAAPGEYEYVCRPHAALRMRGRIIIRDS
jgi:plastocyanin